MPPSCRRLFSTYCSLDDPRRYLRPCLKERKVMGIVLPHVFCCSATWLDLKIPQLCARLFRQELREFAVGKLESKGIKQTSTRASLPVSPWGNPTDPIRKARTEIFTTSTCCHLGQAPILRPGVHAGVPKLGDSRADLISHQDTWNGKPAGRHWSL